MIQEKRVVLTQHDGQQAREGVGFGWPTEAGVPIQERRWSVEYCCMSNQRGGSVG